MHYELMLSIAVNLVAIAYFAGSLKATQEYHAETIENLKEDVNAHFARLEEKQDKHNNLIERMVKVEESSKAGHKRQDNFESRLQEIEKTL